MKNIVICGATSAIALETARCFALEKANLFLIARDPEKLDPILNDLRVRGATVQGKISDLSIIEAHPNLVAEAGQRLGAIDAVLIAHGSLTDQDQAQTDPVYFERESRLNYISPASLAEHFAAFMVKEKSGVVAVISSVAGDRGRGSNYGYGAAKAGLTAYLSGLRNRMQAHGVRVITIKPGFVDTPMTAHIQPKGFLWASAGKVGSRIHKAMHNPKDEIYVPWFWSWIMRIIRNIPEPIFKRLKL